VCRVGSYWLDGLLDPQFIESHQSISLMRVAPENLLCGSVISQRKFRNLGVLFCSNAPKS
jgi:hypothetical protein